MRTRRHGTLPMIHAESRELVQELRTNSSKICSSTFVQEASTMGLESGWRIQHFLGSNAEGSCLCTRREPL